MALPRRTPDWSSTGKWCQGTPVRAVRGDALRSFSANVSKVKEMQMPYLKFPVTLAVALLASL